MSPRMFASGTWDGIIIVAASSSCALTPAVQQQQQQQQMSTACHLKKKKSFNGYNTFLCVKQLVGSVVQIKVGTMTIVRIHWGFFPE